MKTLNLLFIFLFFSILTSCSSDAVDDSVVNGESEMMNVTIPQDKSLELEVLNLINAKRKERGLPKLQKLDIIKSQTYKHTDYMIHVGKLSHDNFLKRKLFLVENAKANHVSENVAFGYNSAKDVVDAWLKSDDHRANIYGNFTHFDISANVSEKGSYFYTNIFVRR